METLNVDREFTRRFFFSSRRRHTRLQGDWSSDVCSSDLARVPHVAERLRETRWVVARILRSGVLHQARKVERVSPRSLLSLRLRWRPSRTNSTAAAIAAGFPVAPTFATAPFIPGICRACFTYSWLERVGETCIVAPRWNAARSESNSTSEN